MCITKYLKPMLKIMKIINVQAPTKLYFCKHKKWNSFMVLGNNNYRTHEFHKTLEMLIKSINEHGLQLNVFGPFYNKRRLEEYDSEIFKSDFIKNHDILKVIELENVVEKIKDEFLEYKL